MKAIKIAPYLDEINSDGKTIWTEFNGQKITYTLNIQLDNENTIRCMELMQEAIALSSQPWQIKRAMDGITLGNQKLGTLDIQAL